MAVKLFNYKKSIDRNIQTAVAEVLKTKVLGARRITKGIDNHVYKVITKDGPLLARVFKSRLFPEDGTLEWVEKQFTAHRIAHAKLLYYSRNTKYFPHGFMVSEFLAGLDGKTAVAKGRLSLSQFFFELGKLLKKIHGIKLKRFGFINNGRGENSDFLKLKLKLNIQRYAGALLKSKQITESLRKKIQEVVTKDLSPFRHRLRPVLVHADPNRQNAIQTSGGQWALVDWDHAIASTWVEDFADLTFWSDYNRTGVVAKRRNKLIAKNFLKGYGPADFSQEEIKKIEHALHIIKCFQILPYFYFVQKDRRASRYLKNKLERLLRENS